MQRMALDTGAVSKWPSVCADIHNYAIPKAAPKNEKKSRAAWELTIQNGTKIEAQMEEVNNSAVNGRIGIAALFAFAFFFWIF